MTGFAGETTGVVAYEPATVIVGTLLVHLTLPASAARRPVTEQGRVGAAAPKLIVPLPAVAVAVSFVIENVAVLELPM